MRVILAASFSSALASGALLQTTSFVALPPRSLDLGILDSDVFTINNTAITRSQGGCVVNVSFGIVGFFSFNFIGHAFTIRRGPDTGLSILLYFLWWLSSFPIMGCCWLAEEWKVGQFSQKILLNVLQEEVVARTRDWRRQSMVLAKHPNNR